MLNIIIDHGPFPADNVTWARPHLMTADDGVDYVVKFPRENDHKSLFNEFVGGKLANHFGLTVLNPVIVKIDQDIIDNSNALHTRGIHPGLYFATQKMNDIYNVGADASKRIDMSNIENLSEVPEFIVYDIFVCNNDRNPNNSILVPINENRGKFRYYLIDHGFCFNGPEWNLDMVQNMPYRLSHIPWNISSVVEDSQFKTPAIQVTLLKSEDLRDVINQVPDEWKPVPIEIEALTKTLTSRSPDEIIKILKDNKAQFANWI